MQACQTDDLNCDGQALDFEAARSRRFVAFVMLFPALPCDRGGWSSLRSDTNISSRVPGLAEPFIYSVFCDDKTESGKMSLPQGDIPLPGTSKVFGSAGDQFYCRDYNR